MRHHLIYSVLVTVCYCRAQGCCITSPCPTTAWCSAAKWWTALFKNKTSFTWVRRPATTRIHVGEVIAESEYPFLWITITNGTLYASIILSTWKQLYKRPQPHIEAVPLIPRPRVRHVQHWSETRLFHGQWAHPMSELRSHVQRGRQQLRYFAGKLVLRMGLSASTTNWTSLKIEHICVKQFCGKILIFSWNWSS